MQIFNEFNARKPDEINVFKGVTTNRLFMGIVGLTLALQVRYQQLYPFLGLSCVLIIFYLILLFAIIQIVIIEFLGKFASTVRLNWQLWLICVGIGFIR